MYAVIETGGKQYTARQGQVLEIEKLEGNKGDKIEFKPIMFTDGTTPEFGTDAQKHIVTAEIVGHYKDKKIVVYKYKAKKNVRKKAGHRQQRTRVKVLSLK